VWLASVFLLTAIEDANVCLAAWTQIEGGLTAVFRTASLVIRLLLLLLLVLIGAGGIRQQGREGWLAGTTRHGADGGRAV
jgi:hypothetical protein